MENMCCIAQQRCHISEKEMNFFALFFKKKKQLVYCDDLPGLLGQLDIPSYNPEEWRLFLNSSKNSLECVLLHNGNRYVAIPIGHFAVLKEQQKDI